VILRSSIPASRLLPAARTSNRPYEVTAEMIEPRQANFITRDALLYFLREHGEVALRAAEQLSLNYYSAHDGIRILGLSNSPFGEICKIAVEMVQRANQRRSATGQTDSYARRNRRDHWHHPRNGQPSLLAIQEETSSIEGCDPSHSQQGRARKNGQLLNRDFQRLP
jgi:CRP-like cAMP-binding protein